MKLRISKKLLTVILLSLLVLLLSVLSYFLVKGFPINWGINKIESYEEIAEMCARNLVNGNLEIKCNAFLDGIELKENNTTCLKVSIVTKESILRQFDICNPNSIIQILDNEVNSDMVVPISITFSYEYRIPIKYELKSIKISHLEDIETFDILRKLSVNGINLFDIQTKASLEVSEKRYYFSDQVPLFPNSINYLGVITFTDTKVNKILVSEDKLEIETEIKINGTEKVISQRVRSINYIENPEDPEFEKWDTSNYKNLDTNQSFSISFLYLKNGKNNDIENILQYCKEGKINWNNICEVEDIEDYLLDVGIEEYINYSDQNFSKLIIDTIAVNE